MSWLEGITVDEFYVFVLSLSVMCVHQEWIGP